MTTPYAETLTLDLALTYVLKMGRVTKIFALNVDYETLAVEGDEGQIELDTQATTVSIARWFSEAGLTVISFRVNPTRQVRKLVTFKVRSRGGQG